MLHVYVSIIDKSFESRNSRQDFGEIARALNKYDNSLSDITVVFEPTGGYEKKLKEFLKTNKINFAIVHPNKVRAYAKARGLLAKTDAIDSKLIFDYAKAFNLSVQQNFSSRNQEHLHGLIQRREQL